MTKNDVLIDLRAINCKSANWSSQAKSGIDMLISFGSQHEIELDDEELEQVEAIRGMIDGVASEATQISGYMSSIFCEKVKSALIQSVEQYVQDLV